LTFGVLSLCSRLFTNSVVS